MMETSSVYLEVNQILGSATPSLGSASCPWLGKWLVMMVVIICDILQEKQGLQVFPLHRRQKGCQCVIWICGDTEMTRILLKIPQLSCQNPFSNKRLTTTQTSQPPVNGNPIRNDRKIVLLAAILLVIWKKHTNRE